jgi:hypothetical protein
MECADGTSARVEDPAPGDADLLAAAAATDGHWVIGDPDGFAWSGCDRCGTRLGGDRYAAAVLISEEAR